MDFTREPIIESVITPKEGCKLVVRSSKAANQEEFFVDSLEVVSFGSSFYFRSLERPKSFIVPASDYEILEVRETRLVLKSVGVDQTIKIAGGREAKKERSEEPKTPEEAEPKVEKKREKRRHTRRRRTKAEIAASEEAPSKAHETEEEQLTEEQEEAERSNRQMRSSLLPPPPNLISETMARYKDNALFKDAFFLKDEDELEGDEEEVEEGADQESIPPSSEEEEFPAVSLMQPEYGSFEITEEEEEEIHRQRTRSSRDENEESLGVDEDLSVEEQETESFEDLPSQEALEEPIEPSDTFEEEQEQTDGAEESLETNGNYKS